MSLIAMEGDFQKTTGKTIFRNTTLCVKLTEQETQLIDELAAEKGAARSEWMRDVILREMRRPKSSDPLLAEILGVRLLLVNVLRPLAAGEVISNETFDKLLDEIANVKHQIAEELAAEGRK